MAEPSLRVTHVHRSGDHAVITTQYISGRNMRFESGGKGHISNQDLHLGFELDLENRTYTAFPANQFGSPKWSQPLSNAPVKKSGRTTYCRIETIDTGDDFKIIYIGEPETGFPIFVKKRSKSFHQLRTGEIKAFDGSYQDEVAELSEAPLERSVFVPPRGFRRVAWLDGSIRYRLTYRLRLRWEFLKVSLTLRTK